MSGGVWKVPNNRPAFMDHGISDELAKCEFKAIGNAVVPQVIEWIGKRIIESSL
jgi:site-specific DNA-cytosine methylase